MPSRPRDRGWLGAAAIVLFGIALAVVSPGVLLWWGILIALVGVLYGVSIALGPRAARREPRPEEEADLRRAEDRASFFDDPPP